MNPFLQFANSKTCEEPKKLTLINKSSSNQIKLTPSEETPEDNCYALDQPFAAGKVFQSGATLTEKITRNDGKEIFCLTLEAPEIEEIDYEPGDTIGILPHNTEETVTFVLKRIGAEADADKTINIVLNGNQKKKYLPKVSTLRKLFKYFINFQGIPLKQLLSVLAEHTLDPLEKTKLQYLASREGATTYQTVILEAGTDFLTVLTSFHTCRPPAAALVEFLPRLLPRPYSISSSHLTYLSKIRVALSIIPSQGLCTGMIRKAFTETNQTSLWIYFRKPHGFRLPQDTAAPLVLVGPGTGVAPFIGFLDHLESKSIRRPVYLITGFRCKEEFIFRSEFEQHLENGVLTKIIVSFSSGESSKYVQDNIREHWQELGKTILDDGGYIYECGDLQRMKNTVSDAFTDVIEKYMRASREEALQKLEKMKSEKRYLRDVWC